MTDLAPLIVRLLFWSLALAVVFAPRRWALLALLVVVHVDASGPGWASPIAVGIENAIKVGVLPTILLARLGIPVITRRFAVPLGLWVALTGYSAVAGLWSPYHLSAAKMVIYLYAYLIVFLVFCSAWQADLIDVRLIALSVWIALGLAIAQTYLLGNPFGTPPKTIIEQARFTSFTSPQSFAAYLVAAAAFLLLASPRERSRLRMPLSLATGAATLVGLFLAGSRYATLGLLALAGVAALLHVLAQTDGQSRMRALKPAAGMAALLVALTLVAAVVAPDNRIFKLRGLVSGGRVNPSAVGTFQWRLLAYQTAWDDIARRGPGELLFGSGTSSAANVILEFNPTAFHADTIDANRSLHNEFLRALYEWGVVGLGLFVAFLTSVIVALAQRSSLARGGHPVNVFWGLLPTLLLSLTLENVLAGSGSPVGVGFALVLAYAAVGALAHLPEGEHAGSVHPQLLPATRG